MSSPEFIQPPKLPPDAPNAALIDFYNELKAIRHNEGMGSITKSDMERLYALMQNPHYFTTENLENMFGLLSQLASTESFEDPEVARECLRQIGFYREELGL